MNNYDRRLLAEAKAERMARILDSQGKGWEARQIRSSVDLAKGNDAPWATQSIEKMTERKGR